MQQIHGADSRTGKRRNTDQHAAHQKRFLALTTVLIMPRGVPVVTRIVCRSPPPFLPLPLTTTTTSDERSRVKSCGVYGEAGTKIEEML